MELLKDLLSEVLVPLRALVIALVGVGLAWTWFKGYWWLVVLISIASIFSGILFERHGAGQLPGDPLRAVRMMEFWVLSPAAVSALAAMIVVAVSVALTAPKGTPTATKELLTATSGALTAFLTSAFIDWTGDKDDSRTANRIRDQFYAHYQRADTSHTPGRHDNVYYFEAGSVGERWVYSNEFGGITGWGYDARRRAFPKLEQSEGHR